MTRRYRDSRHRQARQYHRPRSTPLVEEERPALEGRELWAAAMKGDPQDPTCLAALLSVISVLDGHLMHLVMAVQDAAGSGAAVEEAWAELELEDDVRILRLAVEVLSERARLLVDALGISTEDWGT
jgi:hypothetical protein